MQKVNRVSSGSALGKHWEMEPQRRCGDAGTGKELGRKWKLITVPNLFLVNPE
jgi:hypothetical protein